MLRVRWLGRVAYADALALQQGLWARSDDDHLLLLEHPHVYTLGVRADPAHVLVDPASVGAELVRANRGGDVTYHGPGQLVGYPILTLVDTACGMADTPAYVHALEQTIIDALTDLGLPGAGRLAGYPGVWAAPDGPAPRKICAIGVRISRGRSMHGFALNVDPDPAMFRHIVPCGITEYAVTSLAAEGVTAAMRDVVDIVAARAQAWWAGGAGSRFSERADVAWRVSPDDLSAFTRGLASPAPTPAREVPVRLAGRLAEAGVDGGAGRPLGERKPPWLRVKANLGPAYRSLKRTMRSLDLVTVCEEAGCPNIFECRPACTALR